MHNDWKKLVATFCRIQGRKLGYDKPVVIPVASRETLHAWQWLSTQAARPWHPVSGLLAGFESQRQRACSLSFFLRGRGGLSTLINDTDPKQFKELDLKWYWTPPFSIIWCNFFRNKNQIISSHIFSIWRSPMKTQNHIKMTIYKRKNCLLIKNVATNRFPLMSY